MLNCSPLLLILHETELLALVFDLSTLNSIRKHFIYTCKRRETGATLRHLENSQWDVKEGIRGFQRLTPKTEAKSQMESIFSKIPYKDELPV